MEGRVQDGSRVSWTMDLNLIVTYLGILRRSACPLLRVLFRWIATPSPGSATSSETTPGV